MGDFAGISILLGTVGIGASVMLGIACGLIYDVTFGLWREHMTIIGERNLSNLSDESKFCCNFNPNQHPVAKNRSR